jgi:hypothetical protein
LRENAGLQPVNHGVVKQIGNKPLPWELGEGFIAKSVIMTDLVYSTDSWYFVELLIFSVKQDPTMRITQ